jgi:hypothetical protein
MIKFANNAASTLAAGIASGAASLTLATGQGALFPTLGTGDYTYATIIAANNPASFEIVKVTARSGDVLTITRAQEGTTAAAWVTGDKVELRLTSAMLLEALAGPFREVVTVASIGAGTYTFNLNLGNNWRLTLTGNPTFAFSNPPADGTAQTVIARLIQDATGSRTITYPGSVKWTDGVAPVLGTAAGKVDVLTFTTDDGGATYLGSHAIANA